MSNITIIDEDYKSWLQELSQRYRRSQIKAAVRVNSEMLRYYWSLGRDIVMLKARSLKLRFTVRYQVKSTGMAL